MPRNGFRVNFLIVGAQKGGTTALAHFLSTHPDVCMAPAKEVHFFDDPGMRDSDWAGDLIADRYREHFENFSGQRRIGEASPTYMFLPGVPERMIRYNPSMKLIAILREPADRAVSHYEHARRLKHESLPFVPALLLEPLRLLRARHDHGERSSLRRHSYVSRGQYALQVRSLWTVFPREQILFLRTEELANQHHDTLLRVYRFLDLEPPSALPGPETIHSFLRRHSVPSWSRRWVSRRCLASTVELERSLGWNLRGWKAVAERRRRSLDP